VETKDTTGRTLERMIDALESRDLTVLEGVFAEHVQLRASLPQRDVQRSGRAEAAALMVGWFTDATDIARVYGAVDTVGDVWHAGYRFTLREAGADLVVEQHAYCRISDGLIASVRVMCSGFRPAGVEDAGADASLHAVGDGCATLTPRIAAAMRELESGQVLAVLTDDPAAPDGIAAWSRMTGHEIVATTTESDGARFFLRHS
jgi:tRNA 2-thiouridine synthesizing protein A